MEDAELKRKVAWTTEEDHKLREYVKTHGDQQWDTMSRNLDLGRSGNSCRLRWYNYLKPGIVRGNITDQEMLKILNLHSTFGNQWSKIAQHLPGRTDNEMKNFWNTRVKKEAKLLNLGVESEEFLQTMRERLMERSNDGGGSGGSSATTTTAGVGEYPNPNIGDLWIDQELGNLDYMWTTTLDDECPNIGDLWIDQELGSLDYMWTTLDDECPNI